MYIETSKRQEGFPYKNSHPKCFTIKLDVRFRGILQHCCQSENIHWLVPRRNLLQLAQVPNTRVQKKLQFYRNVSSCSFLS